MKKLALKVWDKLLKFFAAIEWPRTAAFFNRGVYYKLVEADHDMIRQMLKDDYLLIFTRRNSHLTTHLIALISMIVSRRSVHYTHVLMNVEDAIDGHVGYKLLEATNTGVHYSTFMEVFNCDSVALLKPRGIEMEQWTKVLDHAKRQFGKPYDNLFDITNDEAVSCIELVYWSLKQLPSYELRFPKLVELLSKPHANLTPQMLYDTGELEIVFEVRR